MTLFFSKIANKVNLLFKTGNVRHHFEVLYSKNPDPWNYSTSQYELRRYAETLKTLLGYQENGTLLEIGCGTGVFTKMVSPYFSHVTATDISKKSINLSKRTTKSCKNISFIREDLCALVSKERYDVITCADVLCYIPPSRAADVVKQLDSLLKDDGIIIYVTGPNNAWEKILTDEFSVLSTKSVDNPVRPYRIIAFEKNR